jgi:hypothetical protein
MSKTYLLPCKCGNKVGVFASQAGDTLQCANCNNSLSIPTLRELAKLEVLERAARPATDRREHSRNSWSGFRGITVALLLAMACGFFAYSGLYLYGRSTIDTSGSAEAELAASAKIVETMKPPELFDSWQGYLQMGLGYKDRPPFYLAQKNAKYAEWYIITYAVIGAICTTLALLVGLSGRKKQNV